MLIDPTRDFGKNPRHSLALLREARQLADTGRPVLMAPSNKDSVGETPGVELAERVDGTLAATEPAAVQRSPRLVAVSVDQRDEPVERNPQIALQSPADGIGQGTEERRRGELGLEQDRRTFPHGPDGQRQ